MWINMSLEQRYISLTIEENIHVDFMPDTWTVVGYFKGFIQMVSGSEVFQNGKGGEKVTHRLYTHLQTPCKYGYRVTQNGQSYIMLHTIQTNGVSGTGHHKEILMGSFD